MHNPAAGEQCDEGGPTETCNEDCTLVLCGDGVIDGGEECDGAELGGATCLTQGFDDGSLACSGRCTFDLAGCASFACGNEVIDGADQCDGADLGGATCLSQGFDDGSLACSGGCTFDTSACVSFVCGNGVIDGTDQCDGTDLGGASCASRGFDGGTLACSGGCTFDESDCFACGDGVLDPAGGEECDGAALGGGTCESVGFDVGTLACGASCTYDMSECYLLPDAPVLVLGFSQVKLFDFTWAAVAEAEYYRLLERASPGDPWVQLGVDLLGTSVSFERPLHLRWDASYVLQACNFAGCTDSAQVDVMGSLASAVGYVKASNTGAGDSFGHSVALSADGNTLAVGARAEASNATGVNGNQLNNSAANAGAVYVFVRDGAGDWSQQAYVKASNTGANDQFGHSVALSADGSTLAVGAVEEDSNATGIGGDQANNSGVESGAVYVFARSGLGTWSQQAYVKGSNTGLFDRFGYSVDLSADGSTLAVGAYGESSNASGIDGNQVDNSFSNSGAVYVLVRDGVGAWSQQAYVKASNPNAGDWFGQSVALSDDGSTLAVGAHNEDSNATGIGGNQADNSTSSAGAVYVLGRDGVGVWSHQAYVKASNSAPNDFFGHSVALSGDGNTLAVGAYGESSNATGIDGNQADNSAATSGAVYVFARACMGAWSQQAYVKASNTGSSDLFGYHMALSGNGNILAVGAYGESSSAIGINGDQANNAASVSGAAYVLARDGMGTWSQQAYVKASNTESTEFFGWRVAVTGDGNTLAVGATLEDGNATGLGGNQANNAAAGAGAVYLY